MKSCNFKGNILCVYCKFIKSYTKAEWKLSEKVASMFSYMLTSLPFGVCSSKLSVNSKFFNSSDKTS